MAMPLGTAEIIKGDSRDLPLPDNSVDLVVTSPPYFALRSYQDGGAHYDGQIGAEPTPDEFVTALLEVTRECMRVLKPSGSLWVNLGDKYVADNRGSGGDKKRGEAKHAPAGPAGYPTGGMRQKSLMGLPWRYALRCIDELGLILRAEVVSPGEGHDRRYSLDQLERARAVVALLGAGVSLEAVRKHIDHLIQHGGFQIGAVTITYTPEIPQ